MSTLKKGKNDSALTSNQLAANEFFEDFGKACMITSNKEDGASANPRTMKLVKFLKARNRGANKVIYVDVEPNTNTPVVAFKSDITKNLPKKILDDYNLCGRQVVEHPRLFLGKNPSIGYTFIGGQNSRHIIFDPEASVRDVHVTVVAKIGFSGDTKKIVKEYINSNYSDWEEVAEEVFKIRSLRGKIASSDEEYLRNNPFYKVVHLMDCIHPAADEDTEVDRILEELSEFMK